MNCGLPPHLVVTDQYLSLPEIRWQTVGAVVVVALTRTRRGLVSELELTAVENRVPSDCVVNFDNIHTLPRTAFRRRITRLSPARLHEACQTLRASTGC